MSKAVKKLNNKSDDEVEDVDVSSSEDEAEEEIDEVVEEAEKEKPKIVYDRSTFENNIEKLSKIINNKKQELKELENIFRSLKKHTKLIKSKKGKPVNPDGTVKLNQFTKPQSVPKKFVSFYNNCLKNDEKFVEKFKDFNINEEQSRTTVNKIIYYYIQKNNLYEIKEDGIPNKRVILPDKLLTELFLVKDGETIGFSTFKKYEKRLYDSDKVESSDDEKVEIVATKKKVATK